MSAAGAASVAEVQATATVGVAKAADGLDGAAKGQAAAGSQASEVEVFANELRAATRACGADFPHIVDGRIYAMNKEGEWMVPFAQAAQRAREFGQRNPRDFVLGELAVHLGRSKVGYERTDNALRQNTTLRLVVEMVETVNAARAMSTRYPALESAITAHVMTMWSAIADRTKDGGAPESIRTFVLTCLSRALRSDSVAITKVADEHSAKCIETAAALFDELTSPLPVDTQQKLDTERGEADKLAAARVEAARNKLYPYFFELLKLAVPTPTAKAVEQKSLVSAEEAAARMKERAAARNVGTAPTAKAVDVNEVAKADAEKILRAIQQHDLTRKWNLIDRPTPSEIQKSIEGLVASGTVKKPQFLDRTIELMLRAMSAAAAKSAPAPFAARKLDNDNPPWSLNYLRTLAGPDVHAMLSAKAAIARPEHLEVRPHQRGGLGRLFEDKSRSTEARDWVTSNQGKSTELRSIAKLADSLAKFDGVTAEVARSLQRVCRDTQAALDVCRSTADVLERGYDIKAARAFADKRAEFEGLYDKADATMGLLRSISSDQNSGGLKSLMRVFSSAQSTIDLDSVMDGVTKLVETQAGARRYLGEMFAQYTDETSALADVLGPRLDWFDTAVANADSRQTDPLLPLFDGSWLGVVTAELKRSELMAKRILAFVERLPADLKESLKVEIRSADDFKRALITDASNRLAVRLGGRAKDTRTGVGFDVASTQSYALPALAARPRLQFLCAEQGVLQASSGDFVAVDQFGDLSFRNGSKAGYSLGDEEIKERDTIQAARGDYSFWCRTFDLSAPAGSFMSEFLGWRTYHAAPLAKAIDAMGASKEADDLGRIVGDALQAANGVHPVAEVVGNEQSARFLAIAGAHRRLATNERALKELEEFLNPAKQPTAILLNAIYELPKARDKQAAAAVIAPWLTLPDPRLREVARKTLCELEGCDHEQVMKAELAKAESSSARVLVMHDMAKLPAAPWVAEALIEMTSHDDVATRTFAIFCLSEIAGKYEESTALIADALKPSLGDPNPYIQQFASDAFEAMVAAGSSYAAELVITWASAEAVSDPRIAALLHGIADADVAKGIAVEARSAAKLVEANAADLGIKRPRKVAIKRPDFNKAQVATREVSDLVLSAARAMGGERDIDAVSDRMKVALRLVSKFEQWMGNQSVELRPAFEKLDIADGIVDDAVEELTGGEPRGYINGSAEIVSALFSSAGFSAAEITILESGRVPDSLVELANHPMAIDGSWRTTELTAAHNDPEQFKALVQLKLALSSDLPKLVGEVIASVLDKNTPPAIAATGYAAVTDLFGEIPLLDPSLDAAQRQEKLANAPALDPAIDALVERAVVDRLAIVDPKGDEAKTLVQYLASGVPEVAERRLADALDRATSEPQAHLIIDAARGRAKVRARQASGVKQKAAPWLIAVLGAAPKASIEQVIAVRDARQAAVRASDTASLGRAAERVTALATATLNVRETLPAAELSTLLMILADSEDDPARVSKIDGLRELMANTKVPWTPSRMQTVRDGLLIVQANQRWGDVPRTLEQTIGFAARLLGASPGLSDADLGKHFEIVARLGEMRAKTSYADNVIKMYRTIEARGTTLSTTFLDQMGLWLGAIENGAEPERKREVVLAGLLDLVPIPDDTMTTLVSLCASMPLQRTSDVLRLCKDHLRSAHLTPKDVETIVAKGGAVEDNSSIFKSLIGAAVALTQWKPSSSAYTDPLAKQYNDTFEIAEAKRMLRSSIGSIFDTLAAPRGETAPVADLVISNDIGNFALGAWSRSASAARNSDPVEAAKRSGSVDFANIFSSSDYAAHLAQANKLADAALQRVLDGKHPIEQLAGLQSLNSRAIAQAFDGMFSTTADTDWERDYSGPRLDTRAFGRALSARMATIKLAEEAEARGETVPTSFPTAPVMLRPVEIQSKQRDFNLFVSLVIDNSGSTVNDNRLGYFKLLGVMLTNAFGGVNNLKITHAVTKFSDHGQLIMAPARKQDIRTMIQAMGPLVPEGGTNLADGLDKSNMAVGKGKYDLVVHVVLTDGLPNSVPAAKAVIETLRQKGHHVVGFGVGPDAENLEGVFGKGHAIPEGNPDLVAPKVYKYLKEMVERERAR